jgi:hypothetical protein
MLTDILDMIRAGILIPASFLQSNFFQILAAFVAINTVMYLALAVAKILPKIYLTDVIRRLNSRAETRSIYPDGPL